MRSTPWTLTELLGRTVAEDGCLIWQGTTSGGRNGAGKYPHTGDRYAHRLAFELKHGPIAPGLEIDHLCRKPMCVNPDHLQAVTHAENMRRGMKAQQTHCIHGHEFLPENTYVRPNGTRACVVCRASRDRARRA